MQQNQSENPYWDGFVLGAITMATLAGGLLLSFFAPNNLGVAVGAVLCVGSLLTPAAAVWQFRKRAAQLAKAEAKSENND